MYRDKRFIVPTTHAAKDNNMAALYKFANLLPCCRLRWAPERTVTLEGMDKRDVGSRVTTKKMFDKVLNVIVYRREGHNIGRHGSKGSCLMIWQLYGRIRAEELDPFPHAVRADRENLRRLGKVFLVNAISNCTKR